MTNPLSPELFSISVTRDQGDGAGNIDPNRFNLTYAPKEPIPQIIAIVIGDAIHNLRSALDHLAGGIIRTLPTPPSFKPYFPMHPKWENLKSDKSLSAIEEALPGAKKLLLEEIRPTNGPNDALWAFNDLSNLDKHNLVIPTVAIAQVIGSWSFGSNTFTDCGGGGDATRPHHIISTNVPITIQNDLKTTVNIRFAKGDHTFENEPVIPTLTQIGQLVTETLDAFERLINAAEPSPLN